MYLDFDYLCRCESLFINQKKYVKMKIVDVYPYSLAIKALYNANKTAIIAYDVYFNDTYVTTIWLPRINDAEHVSTTLTLRQLNVAETKQRNETMDLLMPVLDDLEYKVKKCIDDGSITMALIEFGIGNFKRSITKREIENFRSYYEVTIAAVDLNTDALVEVGFTEDQIESITTWHDKAVAIQDGKIALEGTINSTSKANQAILNACLKEDQKVLNVIKAYAKSIGDKELAKKATRAAVLKSMGITPQKKAVVKVIKPNSSVLLYTDFVGKNYLHLTLLTDNVTVLVGQTHLKLGVITYGTELMFNEVWVGQKKMMLGTGRYIKLTNTDSFTKAKVRVFVQEVDLE